MAQEAAENRHRSFFIEAEDSDTAALLVHGIYGSPCQFEGIAQSLLAQGCSVMAVLLPGHGGNAKEFYQAKANQCQQAVSKAAEQLRQRYRHVYLVGHSLGALLGICEAAHRGAEGLILISAPVRLKAGFGRLRILPRVLWGDPARDSDMIRSYRLANSVSGGTLWQYMRGVPRLAELLTVMKKARKSLPEVRQRVLVIQSRCDETVSWKSAAVLKEGLRSAAAVEVLILENSGHSYFSPEEASAVQQRICGFMKEAEND